VRGIFLLGFLFLFVGCKWVVEMEIFFFFASNIRNVKMKRYMKFVFDYEKGKKLKRGK